MDILAIVKNCNEDTFQIVTWMSYPYDDQPVTRMHNGNQGDYFKTHRYGTTVEKMEQEIPYLLSCGWSRVV